MKWTHTLAISASILASGAVASRAAPLFDDPFEIRIPYEGELWLDDLPANGAYAFRFYVCNAPAPAPCSAADGEHGWLEEHRGVDAIEVHAGHFAVLLGEQVDLEPISGAASMEIGVDVAVVPDPQQPSDWQTLNGRQRIYGAPFAYRAVPTQTFRIELAEVQRLEAADADIDAATIGAVDAVTVDAQNVTVSDDVTVSGNIYVDTSYDSYFRYDTGSGGGWSGTQYCANGTVVCGLRARTASFLGTNSVSAIQLNCCRLGD